MTSGPARHLGRRSSAGLALSCHPLPTIAVTAISAGLAALAGLSPARGALVVAAVFAGQLSIGWSNDAIDAARDRASRSDRTNPLRRARSRPGWWQSRPVWRCSPRSCCRLPWGGCPGWRP